MSARLFAYLLCTGAWVLTTFDRSLTAFAHVLGVITVGFKRLAFVNTVICVGFKRSHLLYAWVLSGPT